MKNHLHSDRQKQPLGLEDPPSLPENPTPANTPIQTTRVKVRQTVGQKTVEAKASSYKAIIIPVSNELTELLPDSIKTVRTKRGDMMLIFPLGTKLARNARTGEMVLILPSINKQKRKKISVPANAQILSISIDDFNTLPSTASPSRQESAPPPSSGGNDLNPECGSEWAIDAFR